MRGKRKFLYYELTVTDNDGETDTETKQDYITVFEQRRLTLTSPNGGESWGVGAEHNITWQSTGAVTDVKIEYSKDNFTTSTTIIDFTSNTGSYAWTIPNDPSTNVKVRVIDAANPSIKDESDSVFSILAAQTSPTATLTAEPTSGCEPLTVVFTLDGEDGDGSIDSWELDFGDETLPEVGRGEPDGYNITHIYTTKRWLSTSSLPAKMREQATVPYNGYIYLTGGLTPSDVTLNTTYYARINPNGTLGPWNETTPFRGQRRAHGMVAYNGSLYVLGGWSGVIGSATLKDVQYAPIDSSNGTVGSWQFTTPLPEGKCVVETAVVYDNGTAARMYVLGGYQKPGNSKLVHYATINSDGTLTPWTQTTSLPEAGSYRAKIYNNYIYCIRNAWPSSGDGEFYYAKINTDGTLGPWTYDGKVPHPYHSPNTLMTPEGRFYYLGGLDIITTEPATGIATNMVQYVDVTGVDPGNWEQAAVLPADRGWGSAAYYNGYIYYFGGTTSTDVSDSRDEVYYIRLTDPDTSIETTETTERLVYFNDFSTDPEISSTGGHTYKIVDFRDITNYRIEYDWKTTEYNTGLYGFGWDVMATRQRDLFGMGDADVLSIHYPDTDTGYDYGLRGEGGTQPLFWGTPSTDTWYTIKFTKLGRSGIWELYDQGGSLIYSTTFDTNNWSYIDRISVGTWDKPYMNENIYWDLRQENIRVNIWRSDARTSDDSRIDNLKVYALMDLPRTYTAVLTVTDNDGLTNEAHQEITLHSPLEIHGAPVGPVPKGHRLRFEVVAYYNPRNPDDTTIPSYLTTVEDLPPGVDFEYNEDASTDGVMVYQFTWTPQDYQVGYYTIVFTAKNKDDMTISEEALVIVVYDASSGEFRRPVAIITTDPEPPSGPIPLTVTFDGTSSYDNDEGGSRITGYRWDFSDGGSSTNSVVQHTYNDEPGVYTATLTVTDDENQIDSKTIAISVSPKKRFDIKIIWPRDNSIVYQSSIRVTGHFTKQKRVKSYNNAGNSNFDCNRYQGRKDNG